jgi:hypothetical protein
MPRSIQLLCSGIFVIFLSGCYNIYKGTSYINNPGQLNKIDSLQKKDKFFILRTPTSAIALYNLEINKGDSTISFTPGTVPEEHKLHLVKRKGNTLIRKYKPEKVVLNEVHLYSHSTIPHRIGELIQLPVDSIYQVEVLQKDKIRTVLINTFSAVGMAILSFPILIVIGNTKF